MYILLSESNYVAELIPDENPIFPGIPIEQRYTPDFVAKLLHVADDTAVKQNQVYDPETGTFSDPPVPELVPEPEPSEPISEPEYISTADLDAAYMEGVNGVD
nr:MAG TPA: hypothetical protein [Caudoviricetes sp.]